MARKANETTGDGHQDCHFRNAIVDKTEHAAIDGVRQEQASRTSIVKSTTDAHEERRPNGASNCQELDLSIAQSSLKIVLVFRDDPIVDLIAGIVVHLDVVILLGAGELVEDAHDGGVVSQRTLETEKWKSVGRGSEQQG